MADREIIDVEDLLTRAYAEQYVDRITPEAILQVQRPSMGGSSTAGVLRHIALGTTVDTSSAGANFLGRANMMGAIADDWLAVHDAVLALPFYLVETHGELDFTVWDRSTFADAEASGAVIDGAGRSWWIGPKRRSAHGPRQPRALRNGKALDAEPEAPRAERRPLHYVEATVLMIGQGRARERPWVSPLVVERWRAVYADAHRSVADHDPVWETHLATVAIERATYAVWHASLCDLAGKLGNLERFDVRPPAASPTPWLGMPVEYRVLKPMVVKRRHVKSKQAVLCEGREGSEGKPSRPSRRISARTARCAENLLDGAAKA